MVWVDESSSVGEQMTVSSQSRKSLHWKSKKNTLPYNSMVAQFHSVAFSPFNKVQNRLNIQNKFMVCSYNIQMGHRKQEGLRRRNPFHSKH